MTTPHQAPAAPLVRSRLAGLALIVAAYFMFACLDTTAKYLGVFLAPLQVAWFRFLSHSVIAGAALRPWQRPHLFRPRHPVLQVLRSVFLLGSTVFNFLALQHLQLAVTAAIFFLTPFLVTALAGPLLGEWAGWRRWTAIGVGFLGALLIVRPGTADFHPAMFLSLGATTSYAFYLILTRLLTADETAEGMILFPAILAAVVMAPIGLAVWKPVVPAWAWGLLAMTGLIGTLGHWMLIKAHEVAPAPVLAPFLYTQIVWMTLFGWLVFGDLPDQHVAIGGAIIVASGVYLVRREYAVKGRAGSGRAGADTSRSP